MFLKEHKLLTTGFLGAVLPVLFFFDGCSTQSADNKNSAAPDTVDARYIGSQTCKSCHTVQYNDWKTSDHFMAMQEATDSTVVGDFNNRVLTKDGVTSTFFKRDGKFLINTQGPDGRNHDYEVLYTFGHFPLQQYLIAFPGGRLQATRVSWDSREKKWFHQYPGEKIHPHDWLHWTGNGQNWNTMCASCHSTNLQKNYNYEKDEYKTSWNEINVSCESCHGPGSKHVNFINTDDYRNGRRLTNEGLHYTNNTDPRLQLNTCAPCHARMSEISNQKIPSDHLLDNLVPQIISNEFYHADGQIHEEDYEYGSFAQSKMFHNNVRCANCHNPHSGKLKEQGNKLCMSCHQPKYDSKEHHFHNENSEGAPCVNCHMTTKTFMGNDHRRDHSFRVPRPDQSDKYGTPNACTTCHKNQKPAWAAKTIVEWYGPARKYHFSDDLLPGSLLNEQSEKHLIKLLNDTLQPEIARATAVHYLANIQTPGSASAIVNVLTDKKALVRYHALRALENFPPEIWSRSAHHCLSDNVRAVRIAAADLYHRFPEAIPAEGKNAFSKADNENRQFLNYQTDFAVGNIMLGDYELQANQHIRAIEHYIRGLEKDSLMNYARFNLATSYSLNGQNDQALKVLNEAKEVDPKNDRTWYNLGLLHYEMGHLDEALNSFRTAETLGSVNPSLYYNYGILLQQMNKSRDAEIILLKGFSIAPEAANINYALTIFYYQQKNREKALYHAAILKRVDPGNPQYQELFQGLGL